jgi:hypothetical protein
VAEGVANGFKLLTRALQFLVNLNFVERSQTLFIKEKIPQYLTGDRDAATLSRDQKFD